MKSFALPLLGGLLLAGCASIEPATPADYVGPTANVADQAIAVSEQRLTIVEMTAVDGRRLSSTSMATVGTTQGRETARSPVVALTNELPLQAARVRLQATTQYTAPLLALQNPTCRVQGDVDFTPEAGKAYRVTGRVAADACEAWIEDLATHQAVTAKVSGKGTGG